MKSDWGSMHACEGSASEPPGEKDEKHIFFCRGFKLLIWLKKTVGTYSWHDDLLDVIEDTLPVLRVWRRSVREKLLHVTRLYIWNHPPLPDGAQVLCDVVHQLLTWSVTDTVTAGHRHNESVYSKGACDYLCGCIPQPAFLSFWDESSESEAQTWFVVCNRWMQWCFVCSLTEITNIYRPCWGTLPKMMTNTVTLTCLSFHHRSRLVASSIDCTCVVNIYRGRDLLIHVSVMRID